MYRILVVCTGDTCRSPMAEALLKARAERDGQANSILVLSAGLAAADNLEASEGANKAMGKRDIALSEHRSRQIRPEFIEKANLILTMTNAHKATLLQRAPAVGNKLFTLAEYAGEDADIADPYGGSDSMYEKIAEQLANLIDKIWRKIVLEAGKES